MIKCAVSGMAAVGLPAVMLLFFHGRKEADLESKLSYYESINSKSFYTNIYVLNNSVEAGEIIDEKALCKRTVSSSDQLDLCATELSDIAGMHAKIALPAGCVLTGDLVYEGPDIADDERMLDLNNVVLPFDLKAGDIIDIRISFPTGEDYVVVKHKTVHSLITENDEVTRFAVNVREQELLRLSSAGVDTGMYDDTRLYGVRYMGDFQQPAQEYYPVNPEVFELMAWDPNIKDLFTVNAETARRKKLEKHLSNFLSDEFIPKSPDDFSAEKGDGNADEPADPGEQAAMIFGSPELYAEE